MTSYELANVLLKYKNKDVVLQDNFEYSINKAEITSVIDSDDTIIIKMCPYTLIIDSGEFCMLLIKSKLIDSVLDKISLLIQKSNVLSKQDIIDGLKGVVNINEEDIDVSFKKDQ